VFELPTDGSAVIGADSVITTHYEDTLLGIARKYSLGYDEIIRANPGVDMWLPGEGTQILLPGRRITYPLTRIDFVRPGGLKFLSAHHNDIVATYPKMSEAMDHRDRLDTVSL
jgi:LysM repeat protein